MVSQFSPDIMAIDDDFSALDRISWERCGVYFRIQKLLLENAKKGHKVYYYCWDSTAIVQAYQFALHKLWSRFG